MEDFAVRYRNTMCAMWHFPANDQRPAVIAALRRWCRPGSKILDVGAGDGYYLANLAPRLVTAVEPDRVFRTRLEGQSGNLGCSVRTLASVQELRQEIGDEWDADLILMVHALYYLDENELRWLLARVGRRDLVLVYPDPARSVTVGFERVWGSDRSQRRLAIKSAMLGEPLEEVRADSHFRLPLDTPTDDLAFLVSHPLLQGPDSDSVMQAARTFVADRIDAWRVEGFLELPQSQVMETYRGVATAQPGEGIAGHCPWTGFCATLQPGAPRSSDS